MTLIISCSFFSQERINAIITKRLLLFDIFLQIRWWWNQMNSLSISTVITMTFVVVELIFVSSTVMINQADDNRGLYVHRLLLFPCSLHYSLLSCPLSTHTSNKVALMACPLLKTNEPLFLSDWYLWKGLGGYWWQLYLFTKIKL